MNCPFCQTPLHDGDQFCENCGRPVAQPVVVNEPSVQGTITQSGEPPKKRLSGWMLTVIIVVVLVLFCGVTAVGGFFLFNNSSQASPLIEENGAIAQMEASASTEIPPLEINPGGLTPQELAHQGTHIYELICTYEDGDVDYDGPVSVTFDFVESGVNQQHEDEDTPMFFQAIGINTYEGFIDGESLTAIFSDTSVELSFPSNGVSCSYVKSNISGSLTPQEWANAGTHTYEITCTRDGDSENFKPHILTFEFVEDGVNWIYEDEEGASFFYQKIGINTYAMIEGEEKNTMIFTDVSILEETYTGRNCTYTRE